MERSDQQKQKEHFRALTTEKLEAIVRSSVMSPECPISEDVLEQVLEVIAERAEEQGKGIDKEAAWRRFETLYCAEEGRGLELYCRGEDPADADSDACRAGEPLRPQCPSNSRRWLRRLIPFAAALAALLGLSIAVQASGVDIFGALAQWTDEVFRFTAASSDGEVPLREDLGDTELSVPLDCFPARRPARFALKSVSQNSDEGRTSVILSYADGEDWLYVSAYLFNSAEDLERFLTEKEAPSAVPHNFNGTTFYILENSDAITAVWAFERNVGFISGQISREELMGIINSVGG